MSDQTGDIQAVNNDLEPGNSFTVEKAFSEVSAEDYDALVVPGDAVGPMSKAAAPRRWSSYAASSSRPSLWA